MGERERPPKKNFSIGESEKFFFKKKFVIEVEPKILVVPKFWITSWSTLSLGLEHGPLPFHLDLAL